MIDQSTIPCCLISTVPVICVCGMGVGNSGPSISPTSLSGGDGEGNFRSILFRTQLSKQNTHKTTRKPKNFVPLFFRTQLSKQCWTALNEVHSLTSLCVGKAVVDGRNDFACLGMVEYIAKSCPTRLQCQLSSQPFDSVCWQKAPWLLKVPAVQHSV